jgi:hypothetical protein
MSMRWTVHVVCVRALRNAYRTTTKYMKHTHAAGDYADRCHKEIETVFTQFNRATYFNFNFNFNRNFNFKIETSSTANNLA